MKGEGVMRIGSSATIVLALRGDCGAAVAQGNSTGSASATREAGTEGTGLKAAAPEDRGAALSTMVVGEGAGAIEGFTAFNLFFEQLGY